MRTLKSIAKTINLDFVELSQFAILNSKKYEIVNDDNDDQVIADWYVNNLVLDFFEFKLDQENFKTLMMFKMEQIRKLVYQ